MELKTWFVVHIQRLQEYLEKLNPTNCTHRMAPKYVQTRSTKRQAFAKHVKEVWIANLEEPTPAVREDVERILSET